MAAKKKTKKPAKKRSKKTDRATLGKEGVSGRVPKGTRLEGKNKVDFSLTPDVHKLIVGLVERGNWRSIAAKIAGVPVTTLFSWIKRGEEHLEEIVAGERRKLTRQAEFVLDLHRAEGQLHDFHNAKLLEEAKPELRFAWLQKRFPQEWAGTATGRDDQTGEVTDVDLIAVLLDRLKPLKESM